MVEDPNDIHRSSGPEALRQIVDETPGHKIRQIRLDIGSDYEVATCIARDLRASMGDAVYCDEDFYAWSDTHWIRLPIEQMHPFIREYDGCKIQTISGNTSRYRLSKTRHESILHLLRLELLKPDFFCGAPLGVACRSGFIVLGEDGEVALQPHTPDQRQRHLIDANWSGDAKQTLLPGSLLDRLLTGCFRGDEDAGSKTHLLAEMMGAAAFGLATRLVEPKAIILLGETAGNGKSQVLAMMRGLLPGSAVSSVTPAEMGDKGRRAQLAGIRLNTADELGVDSIRSDTFKAVVSGDRMSGKTVYRPPFEFYPEAFHVFATNTLPPFNNGMDAGVRRRLTILPFERPLPIEERIPNLGKRIASEETDALLAMAVAGARRLLRQGAFSNVTSGKQIMANWIVLSDMVAAFFGDETAVLLTGSREDYVTSKQAYEAFRKWTKEEGIPDVRRPTHGQFTAKVKTLDFTKLKITRSGKTGTRFNGLKLPRRGSSVAG